MALRVSNSNAAGCRNGSISARPSLPITSAAAATARSVSAASAVVTSSCARSVRSAPSGAATWAAPKPVSAAEPSDRTIRVSGVHLPVRDAELVEAAEDLPSAAKELVVDLVRIERAQRASARVEHEERIALVRLPRRDDRHHGDAAPLGGQREERLVLDLLEPAGPDAFRAPVPDRVPRGGHELAVRGVATEDLDEERPTLRRGGEGEGHAPRLQGGIPGGGRVDAEFLEDLGDLIEGEPPAG